MNDREYKAWMIAEILKTRKAYCRRNGITKEVLESKTTKHIENIYDRAR